MAEKNFHIAIVEARYYESISERLMNSALGALKNAGASHEHVLVPGALEIPAAIRVCHDTRSAIDGFVALGCVIRGETSHYEIVAGESARGLMELTIQEGVLIGNGILTVDTYAQANKRADEKGAFAVHAVLSLLGLKVELR